MYFFLQLHSYRNVAEEKMLIYEMSKNFMKKGILKKNWKKAHNFENFSHM